jgi:hypothetical protein
MQAIDVDLQHMESALAATLTTIAFDDSSLQWFEACP